MYDTGLIIIIFIIELNQIDIWAIDIGNAYLESTKSEKVFSIDDPEFGEKQG